MENKHSMALLNRGVLRVSGADAGIFLQGLITNDLDKTVDGKSVYAALLSPQGKILFSFFIVRRDDAFWIDCPAELTTALAKRFALYKLRSAVSIEDVSQTYSVTAAWGDASASDTHSFADSRMAALGFRRISPRAALPGGGDYDAHRIALAVPEGGRDYSYGDAFPHDACMDLLNGVDFKKGCYVGQEIVSRMQHRGTARRRVVTIEGDSLTPGSEIMANDAPLGVLGSASGRRGVAIVRLDRAGEAIANGVEITAGGAPVSLAIPSWANYAFGAPQPHDAH